MKWSRISAAPSRIGQSSSQTCRNARAIVLDPFAASIADRPACAATASVAAVAAENLRCAGLSRAAPGPAGSQGGADRQRLAERQRHRELAGSMHQGDPAGAAATTPRPRSKPSPSAAICSPCRWLRSTVDDRRPGSAGKPLQRHGSRAAAARSALHRGAAVRQHERRSRSGVLRRRHLRGPDHRAVPHPLAVRHRPQFDLCLQGPRRRCAGRSRASSAFAMCCEGSVRRAGKRLRISAQLIDALTGGAPLGRTIRPRTRRHLRRAG